MSNKITPVHLKQHMFFCMGTRRQVGGKIVAHGSMQHLRCLCIANILLQRTDAP